MANRTLRRPAKSRNGSGADGEIGNGADEQPTPTIGGVAGSDGSDATTQPANDGDVDDNASATNDAGGIGVVEVDPADLDKFIASGGQRTDTGTDTGEPRRRRRRSDTGTTRRSKSKGTPQDITPLLTMVHTWAPIMLNIPELHADEAELKQLSDAYSEFCKHHDMPEVTEKRISEANLVIALMAVYGTRLVAFAKRKKTDAPKRAPVMPINGPMNVPQAMPN